MLRSVLFSAILLQAVGVAAADNRSSFLKKVDVGRQRVIEVKTQAELYRMSGKDRINACTRFAAYQLSASCSGSDNEWSMTASARFTPYTFLFRHDERLHEKLHVRDVQESAAHYLRELEADRFENRSMCESAAARAVRDFPRQMEQFVHASDEKRHCSELRK